MSFPISCLFYVYKRSNCCLFVRLRLFFFFNLRCLRLCGYGWSHLGAVNGAWVLALPESCILIHLRRLNWTLIHRRGTSWGHRPCWLSSLRLLTHLQSIHKKALLSLIINAWFLQHHRLLDLNSIRDRSRGIKERRLRQSAHVIRNVLVQTRVGLRQKVVIWLLFSCATWLECQVGR